MHPLQTFRVPLVFTVIAVVGAGLVGGPKIGLVVALLAVLEISISFDNAIVNAAVLKTMSDKWQRIFLTWGILIAVFGMRLIFPIVIVSLAAGLGLTKVVDLALHDQHAYAKHLTEAYPDIAAFGGIFLLLVFLNFFLDEEKDSHWLGPIERPLSKLGHIDSITSAVAAIVLLILSQVVRHDLREPILVSGIAGMVAYLLSNGIAGRLEESLEESEGDADEIEDAGVSASDVAMHAAGALAKGGLASFLYLELLDASFSFDGVIGAFAISTDIIVIAIGLGLGALYIRTMTVYLVRAGTLSEYRFLEHGAHWAIGILSVLLFIGIEHHIPEVVTGSLGAVTIIVAFLWSIRMNRVEEAAEAAGTSDRASA